jgi:ribonucleoside-triphosphate reductase
MNINVKLNKNFTTAFNKMLNDYGTDLAELNGFSDSQLSYTDFIDNFIDKSTVADSSIDGNSNVSHKDIVTLEKEMPKPHEKMLAFNKIHYEIQKKYGFKIANEWLQKEWIGELYLHDANTSTFKHYCFAYDLKDLAERGLYFIDGRNSKPAKHLSTFVDFVKEFVSYASNRSSGACGLPNLIPYMFYFWKKDIENNYVIKDPDYYARQEFQRFIYAVNQPYCRDGSQSAFTNTSVFDHPYFEALFGGSQFPDGSFMIDYEEEIIEFQKMYMEVMSDIRSENMFTFPVSTISLLRKDVKFIDDDFARWAIKHNMKWSDSNLFVDTSVIPLL